jgi:hypothetical protein
VTIAVPKRTLFSLAVRARPALAQRLNAVKVSVADVRVEHEVKLMDFTKWLERAERFNALNIRAKATQPFSPNCLE